MVFTEGQRADYPRADTTIIPRIVQNKKPKGPDIHPGRPLGKLRINHPANTTFQKDHLCDFVALILLSGDFFIIVIYRGRFVTSVGWIGPFFYHRFAAATISTTPAIYCHMTVIHTVAHMPPMCQALWGHCVILSELDFLLLSVILICYETIKNCQKICPCLSTGEETDCDCLVKHLKKK